MSLTAILTLALTILVAIVIISDKFRPDMIAIVVMVLVGILRLVPSQEVFSGFSSSVVITLIGVSIISESLHQTGFAVQTGRLLQKIAGSNEKKLIFWVTLLSAGIALFMNNIAVVSVLLPSVMTLARRTRTSASRLLIPLSYGTLLGGMTTLLTTSNMIGSDALIAAGYEGFNLLSFLPVGIPLTVVGLVFLTTIGRKLLPAPPEQSAVHLDPRTELHQIYHLSTTLSELQIKPDSILVNKPLSYNGWTNQLGLVILGIYRNQGNILSPNAKTLLLADDRLIVQRQPAEDALIKFGLEKVKPIHTDLDEDSISLAELVVTPRSTLIGKTIRTIPFREKYNLNVLAIWHAGVPQTDGIRDLPLQFGDALLVFGAPSQIRALRRDPDLMLTKEDSEAIERPQKSTTAILITLFSLAIVAVGLLPVTLGLMLGAVMMLLTGCIKPSEAYRYMEWKVIFIIAGMWPLSLAIHQSGLAENILSFLGFGSGVFSPLIVVIILILIAILFTQFLGGQVAALVLMPMAIVSAQLTNLDPRALVMAASLGCSLGFITPYGHPVNLLIMGPGGYRFKDFVRIGTPLTILCLAVIMVYMVVAWNIR